MMRLQLSCQIYVAVWELRTIISSDGEEQNDCTKAIIFFTMYNHFEQKNNEEQNIVFGVTKVKIYRNKRNYIWITFSLKKLF